MAQLIRLDYTFGSYHSNPCTVQKVMAAVCLEYWSGVSLLHAS